MILKLEDIGKAFQVTRVTTSDVNVYQKGKYRVRLLGNAVGFAEIGNTISVIEPLIFSNWLDEFDVAFPTLQALLDDIALKCFFAAAGGAVDSVNGQTGVVVLDNDDVGAWGVAGLTTLDTGTVDILNPVGAGQFTLLNNDFSGADGASGITMDNTSATAHNLTIGVTESASFNEVINFFFGKESANVVLARFTDSRTTTVGIQYDADYSAGFGDRSLVDKAFVDAAVGVASGWPLTGDFNTTGNVKLEDFTNQAGNSLIFESDDGLDASRFTLEFDQILLGAFASGDSFPEGQISVAQGTAFMSGLNTGTGATLTEIAASSGLLRITDNRAGAAQQGMLYAADYSANFVDRSLIDKGFSDAAYWVQNGTTTLTANTTVARGVQASTDFVQMNITDGNWNLIVQNSSLVGLAIFQSTTSLAFVDTINTQTVTLGAGTGLAYAADYSGTFVDRSLVDKAFVWATAGVTALTVDAFIQSDITADLGIGIVDEGLDEFGLLMDGTNSLLKVGYGADLVSAGNTGTLDVGWQISDTEVFLIGGKINMAGLPTSAAGLNTGDLWNNSNVLNIAP